MSETHACTGPVVRTLTELESCTVRLFPVRSELPTTDAEVVVTATRLQLDAKWKIIESFYFSENLLNIENLNHFWNELKVTYETLQFANANRKC